MSYSCFVLICFLFFATYASAGLYYTSSDKNQQSFRPIYTFEEPLTPKWSRGYYFQDLITKMFPGYRGPALAAFDKGKSFDILGRPDLGLQHLQEHENIQGRKSLPPQFQQPYPFQHMLRYPSNTPILFRIEDVVDPLKKSVNDQKALTVIPSSTIAPEITTITEITTIPTTTSITTTLIPTTDLTTTTAVPTTTLSTTTNKPVDQTPTPTIKFTVNEGRSPPFRSLFPTPPYPFYQPQKMQTPYCPFAQGCRFFTTVQSPIQPLMTYNSYNNYQPLPLQPIQMFHQQQPANIFGVKPVKLPPPSYKPAVIPPPNAYYIIVTTADANKPEGVNGNLGSIDDDLLAVEKKKADPSSPQGSGIEHQISNLDISIKAIDDSKIPLIEISATGDYTEIKGVKDVGVKHDEKTIKIQDKPGGFSLKEILPEKEIEKVPISIPAPTVSTVSTQDRDQAIVNDGVNKILESLLPPVQQQVEPKNVQENPDLKNFEPYNPGLKKQFIPQKPFPYLYPYFKHETKPVTPLEIENLDHDHDHDGLIENLENVEVGRSPSSSTSSSFEEVVTSTSVIEVNHEENQDNETHTSNEKKEDDAYEIVRGPTFENDDHQSQSQENFDFNRPLYVEEVIVSDN